MARTLVASDNFNRADGAVGSNWSYLYDNSWQPSSPAITSNKVYGLANSTASQVTRWNGSGTFADNQYAKVVISGMAWYGADYRVGVTARCSADTDTNSDYYVYYLQDDDSTNRTAVLAKRVNGTLTTLNSATVSPFGNGDTIEIECEGTTIRGFKNGVQQVSVTDSSLTTGKPGFYIGSANSSLGPWLDDWEGGDLTSAATSDVIQRGRQPMRALLAM